MGFRRYPENDLDYPSFPCLQTRISKASSGGCAGEVYFEDLRKKKAPVGTAEAFDLENQIKSGVPMREVNTVISQPDLSDFMENHEAFGFETQTQTQTQTQTNDEV